MKPARRLRSLVAIALCSTACALAFGEDGMPPPPSVEGEAWLWVEPTKPQIRSFWLQVIPAYLGWSSSGGLTQTGLPAFMNFMNGYPCSQADRFVFMQLYLENEDDLP